MANREHLKLLKQGSSVWNAWRKQYGNEQPDFHGVNFNIAGLGDVSLRSVNLHRANLSGANLRETDLSYGDLGSANLIGADLSNAILIGTKLIGTNLTYANLTYANLSSANLINANLSSSNLHSTDLSKARVWNTMFANVDLSTIKGLETLQHEGPSTIGINTIYRSQGKIPERFLREAGVPDSFLEYMHPLIGQPIRYFTCFISHSHHDQRFCDRLYADLRHYDIPSWYFPEDATWGKTVWGEIDRSIKIYDKLVVVCSEHSLKSPAVQREIERALQREDREGKNILFPLRLDNYLFHDWEHERKADVVNKIAGDFRGWESSADKYDKAFQKFLKALKAQEEIKF